MPTEPLDVAVTASPVDPAFALAARRVRPSAALDWYSQGWTLFKRAPGVWVAVFVIGALIGIVLNLVPLIGGVIFNLVWPILMGGMMLGCKAVEARQPLEINHLFAGFSQRTSRLVVVGAVVLVGTLIAAVALAGLIGFSALPALLGSSGAGVLSLGIGTFLGLAVMLIVFAAISMAAWFAPALVIVNDVAPIEAMRASFSACTKNVGAMALFGLCTIGLMILACIPLMLGWLIVGPLLVTATWAAYRSLFYTT